jgi:superfamily II DNA/RNA helicase
VDVVAKSLIKHGFNAAPLHGDLDQSLRTRTLDGFRAGTIQLLVASDVAARGLDIPAVSHVLNYDVPFHADDYVHRIGRTGRAGRAGHAYMLATSRDFKQVEAIEKLTGNKLTRRTLEGLAEATQERPKDDRRGNRDRNKRSGSGGRGRERDHHRKVPHHGHHAAMEPVETQAPAPVQEQAAAPQAEQRPAEQPHAPRPPKQDRQRHKPQKQSRPQQQPQQKAPGADASQLPAFLLRPVKLPPAKPPTAKKSPEEV